MYRHKFNCTFLLLRGRVADHPLSSAFRQPADILKGNDDGNSERHFMLSGSGCDPGNCRPGFPADVEKSVSGLPCPEFKRIVDIPDKITKFKRIVKKIIDKSLKDKLGKPCQDAS